MSDTTKKPMTPLEFEKAMLSYNTLSDGDTEEIHCKMDSLMCELLISLGYEEGVKFFREAKKWYA